MQKAIDTAIQSLDLSAVHAKLHAEGWGQDRTAAADADYRQYLHLRKTRPGEQISPTTDADAFWHAHILDTRRYTNDCQAVFGAYLHHTPAANDPAGGRKMTADGKAWCF